MVPRQCTWLLAFMFQGMRPCYYLTSWIYLFGRGLRKRAQGGGDISQPVVFHPPGSAVQLEPERPQHRREQLVGLHAIPATAPGHSLSNRSVGSSDRSRVGE